MLDSDIDNVFVAILVLIVGAILIAVAIGVVGGAALFFINWLFNAEAAYTVTNIIYAAAVVGFGDIASKLFGAMLKGLIK